MDEYRTKREGEEMRRQAQEIAERVRVEEEQRWVDFGNSPGVRQLREWGEAQKEQKRLEQRQCEKERQEALKAQAAEEMRALEGWLREKFVRSGGTAEEWPEEWPSIRAQILRERTLAGEDYYSAVRNSF